MGRDQPRFDRTPVVFMVTPPVSPHHVQVLAPLAAPDLLWVAALPAVSEELLFRGALIPAVYPDWCALRCACLLDELGCVAACLMRWLYGCLDDGLAVWLPALTNWRCGQLLAVWDMHQCPGVGPLGRAAATPAACPVHVLCTICHCVPCAKWVNSWCRAHAPL